jgi:hypothetical protein
MSGGGEGKSRGLSVVRPLPLSEDVISRRYEIVEGIGAPMGSKTLFDDRINIGGLEKRCLI